MKEVSEQQDSVYGIHSVEAVLKSDAARISTLFIQKDKYNSRIKHLLRLANKAGVDIQQVSADWLNECVDGNHQGVLAQCSAQRAYAEEDIARLCELPRDEQLEQSGDQRSDPLLLVLDGVTDPHNLGACLRSADAAGVRVVILPKDNSAPASAVVSKVASGAAEVLPMVRVTNLARCLDNLKQMGFWITGTTGDSDLSIYDADLTGKRVIVMGSEGKGMRRLTQEKCDENVRIPLMGSVGSLNVSVATGICLFEAVRQRR